MQKRKSKGNHNIVTDTEGNLVGLCQHAARNIQDRESAGWVLAAIRSRYPWLRHIFADGGYAEKLRTALKRIGEWTINHQTFRHGAVLRSSATQMGCRSSFAWLGRFRRLKRFEATIASAVPGRRSPTSAL